jgi:hypothetical protein
MLTVFFGRRAQRVDHGRDRGRRIRAILERREPLVNIGSRKVKVRTLENSSFSHSNKRGAFIFSPLKTAVC